MANYLVVKKDGSPTRTYEYKTTHTAKPYAKMKGQYLDLVTNSYCKTGTISLGFDESLGLTSEYTGGSLRYVYNKEMFSVSGNYHVYGKDVISGYTYIYTCSLPFIPFCNYYLDCCGNRGQYSNSTTSDTGKLRFQINSVGSFIIESITDFKEIDYNNNDSNNNKWFYFAITGFLKR